MHARCHRANPSMATTRCTSMGVSVLPLLILLLLLSVSLVAGAVDVKEACAKTPYPDLCTAHLKDNPEAATADERGLAQIAMGAGVNLGYHAAKVARYCIRHIEDKARQACMKTCALKIELATSRLGQVDDRLKVMDDAKFNDVRRFVESTEKDTAKWKWNCDDCRVPPPAAPDLISKGNDFEKFMAVISALAKQIPAGAVAPAPAPPN